MDLESPLFDDLLVWIQADACSGPVNMAIDELLLKAEPVVPILRVYRWDGEWATMGYFSDLEEAQGALPGVPFVRRWTGGGVVDHRIGHTYSFVIPRKHSAFKLTSVDRYKRIHCSLQKVLKQCNVDSSIIGIEENAEEANCFLHPVENDLVDASGGKIAGAGQRRSREGVLYQGAVQINLNWQSFAEALPRAFARKYHNGSFEYLLEKANELAKEKYPVL